VGAEVVGAGAGGVLCGDDVLGDVLGLDGALGAMAGGVMVAGGALGAGVYAGADRAAVAGDDDTAEAGAEAGG
jgi:hypothetical protein